MAIVARASIPTFWYRRAQLVFEVTSDCEGAVTASAAARAFTAFPLHLSPSTVQ